MNDIPGPPHATRQELPADVAELAGERGLGELRAVHGDANPLAVGGGALLLATVAVGVGALGASLELRPLVIVAFFGTVVGTVMLLVAVGTAVAGRRECHLFRDGFVYRRRRRLRAVDWPEVAGVVAQAGRGLKRWKNDGGWIVAWYRIELHDGTKIRLPIGDIRSTAQPFQDHFEQLVERAGVPVELQMMGAR